MTLSVTYVEGQEGHLADHAEIAAVLAAAQDALDAETLARIDGDESSETPAGAQAKAAAAQAVAVQRANHTGSQAQSTVTDLVDDLATVRDEIEALSGATVPVNAGSVGALDATDIAASTFGPFILPHPGDRQGNASSTTLGANSGMLAMVTVPVRTTVNRIIASIGTSSGNIDVGIYDDDDTGGAPGTKLVSTGSIACPATGSVAITVADTVLAPGRYWVAIAGDNGTYSLGYRDAPISRALGPLRYTKAASFPLPASLAGSTPDAGSTLYALWAGHS